MSSGVAIIVSRYSTMVTTTRSFSRCWVEKICEIPKEEFCGQGKSAAAVTAKEALIVIGRQAGASVKLLSELTGLSASTVGRRYDAGNRRMRDNPEMNKLLKKIESEYWKSLSI
jgi:hypothetical protein